jgi:hypothetical protein
MDVSCVELRKASCSGTNGAGRVEVSTREIGGRRLAGGSRYLDDGALAITPAEWRAFIVPVKAGQSGLP